MDCFLEGVLVGDVIRIRIFTVLLVFGFVCIGFDIVVMLEGLTLVWKMGFCKWSKILA